MVPGSDQHPRRLPPLPNTTALRYVDVFIAHAVDPLDCRCSAPRLALQNLSMAEVCSACASAGGVLSCRDESTIASSFGLYCDRDWLRSVSPAFYFLGTLLASLGSGVADRFGRRPAFVVSRSLSAGFMFACAAAPNLPLYAALKLAVGFTTTIGTVSSYPLACELVGPRLRTRMTVELWCYVWALSCAFLALLAYALRAASWRTLVLACGVPYLLLAAGYQALVPESPFWLLERGERSRALRIAHRLVGAQSRLIASPSAEASRDKRVVARTRGATRMPLEATDVAVELGPPPQLLRDPGAASTSLVPNSSRGDHVEVEDERIAPIPAAAEEAPPPQLPASRRPVLQSWLELFSTAASTRAMLAEMYLWATVSLSYYAIGYNAGNLSDQVHLNFLLISIPLFFAASISSLSMDHPRLGRRGACTLFYASIALVIGAGALWPSVATAASLYGNLCAMAAFNVIYVHTAELWPTKLRASALGLCSAAGKLGSFFSSPLPGILGSTATLAVISAMCALAVVIGASLPETRGRGLPEGAPGGA